MDKGNVQILAFDQSQQTEEIANITSSLGFSTQVSEIRDYGKRATLAQPHAKLLVMERKLSQSDIAVLRTEVGLCNVMITHPELLDDCPDACLAAADYCALPCDENDLERRILRSRLLLQQGGQVPDQQAIEMNMVGKAPSFLSVIQKIRRYALINAPTLITGDTGTGKELAARAIHYSGLHRNGPFQALNCGAIPDHLVENELFGHAKGAFTDARTAQQGLVELAAGGTLFLDEVDTLSPKAQATLLRFLQDGTYRELGSGREKQVDIRIISATNQNLNELALQGSFRQDLIYRLNALALSLPSLKHRKQDIALLARHFLHACETNFNLGSKVFHPAALEKMLRHNWPGNVRELENYVQRAYLSTDSPLITMGPVDEDDHATTTIAGSSVDCIDNPLDFNFGELGFNRAKQLAVEKFEAEYVSKLLAQTQGNVSEAARIAGKERRCFGRLVKKYQIDRTKMC